MFSWKNACTRTINRFWNLFPNQVANAIVGKKTKQKNIKKNVITVFVSIRVSHLVTSCVFDSPKINDSLESDHTSYAQYAFDSLKRIGSKESFVLKLEYTGFTSKLNILS